MLKCYNKNVKSKTIPTIIDWLKMYQIGVEILKTSLFSS